jgi:DNA-binding transcriptional LysR family regulator
MNMHDLEAFVAVVETGSIVAASARLNLTQPGVTRRIQNLEQALAAELLDRQSKPFKPTAAGRDAYEHARRMIRSLEDLKAGLREEGDLSGEFRLGVMPHLSELSLSRPLDLLRGEFPRLTLKIASGWSPRLVDQVSRSELDAAVVALPDGVSPPEGLVGAELGVQRVLVVAAPALGVPADPTIPELASFPWVVNENGCGFRDYIRHALESARLPFNAAVEAMSSDLRLSLVARGLGIGVVTRAALAGSPWRDAVEIIGVKGFSPVVRCWAIHRPPAGRLARPIATFAAAVREELAATAD